MNRYSCYLGKGIEATKILAEGSLAPLRVPHNIFLSWRESDLDLVEYENTQKSMLVKSCDEIS